MAAAQNSGRIATLDILRGLAIIGVVFLHTPWMGNLSFAPRDPKLIGWSDLDAIAYMVLSILLEGRFRGLLELLFGAGAAILLARTTAGTGPVRDADIYFRRCLLLVGIGAIHATLLLQSGDILLIYGVAGLFLYGLRTLSPRMQISLAALILAAGAMPGAIGYYENLALREKVEKIESRAPGTPLTAEEKKTVESWKEKTNRPKDYEKEIEKEKAAVLGSYSDNLAFAMEFWKIRFSLSFLPAYGEALATMLIGMALFRSGILQGNRPAGFYVTMMLVGYGIGLPLRIAEFQTYIANDFSPAVVTAINPFRMTYDLARIGITLGHLSLLLLVLKAGRGRVLLAPLAAPGRMALSVYVMQTFICMWLLFPGFGLGLWGRMGWAGLFATAMAIAVVQIILAKAWLSRFEMGPLEWLLRAASRLELPGLRRRVQTSA